MADTVVGDAQVIVVPSADRDGIAGHALQTGDELVAMENLSC
jgi:hypothetical protein